MFSRQLSVQTMQSARTIKKNGTDCFFIQSVPFFNRSSIPTETVIVKQNSQHTYAAALSLSLFNHLLPV